MSNEIDKPLVNRVANSSLVTINLEDYFPSFDIADFDLQPYLFRGLILKEKDFRLALKEIDWSKYQDKALCVFCSADAIIPQWAYMLVTAYATPYVQDIILGDSSEFLHLWYQSELSKLDLTHCDDERVIIKGCSNKPVPTAAYVILTKLLQPMAKSIMYGEPCSTVPVYKKRKK